MSFELFLATLKDPSADLSISEFHEVSDLSPQELGQFAQVWVVLPQDRQSEIVSTMVALAEDNPDLDFMAIFKMCLKYADDEILEAAINGLWEHEDRSIIPGLINVLQSDKTAKVRAAAALAMGKFPVLALEGKLLAKDGDLVHHSLMCVLEDEDEEIEVRRRCLEAVSPFNSEIIRSFVSWAYESEDDDLRSSAIYAMGRTGDESWLPVLLEELQSPEVVHRYEAANACGELGEEGAVVHLISLVQDDDLQVQLAGIGALGKIGGPLAKRVLVNCAKNGDAALEDAARAELENLEFFEDPLAFSSEG